MTHVFSGGPVRMFRLTNEPGGLGLSCTPEGVSLAGVPLLRKTQAGFAPPQNRLLDWQRYEYKSPQEGGHLASAAWRLFQGAINSSLVSARDLPPSILDAAGTIALLENSSPTRPLPRTGPRVEEPPPTRFKPIENVEVGAIVDRETAGIVWGKSIREQGIGQRERGWEKYNAEQNPDAKLLPPGSKGFDLFAERTGEAISAKTLDTKTMTCIRKPQEIYKRVTRYVDEVVNAPRRGTDVDPAVISSKTIELAIPEQTSPEQWRYLLWAIIYGKDNRVKIVVTRIKG